MSTEPNNPLEDEETEDDLPIWIDNDDVKEEVEDEWPDENDDEDFELYKV